MEDARGGGKRGKRWKTRNEVEVEALETTFNTTIDKECHRNATQIRACVASIQVIQQTSKAERALHVRAGYRHPKQCHHQFR